MAVASQTLVSAEVVVAQQNAGVRSGVQWDGPEENDTQQEAREQGLQQVALESIEDKEQSALQERVLTNSSSHSIMGPEPEPEPELNPKNFLRLTGQGWLWLGVGLLLVGGIAGAKVLAMRSAPPTPTEVAPPPAPSVTAVGVQTTPVTRVITLAGTVEAMDMLSVLPQATGLQIQQVLVDEGDSIQTGQVLVQLDDAVLRSRLAAAQAAVDTAQASVREAEAALLNAQASQGEGQAALEQAQARVAQAQATLARDRRELERSQSLADQGAISRQQLDLDRTTVQTSDEAVRVVQADIRSAQARLRSIQATVESAIAQVDRAKSQVRSEEAEVAQIQTQLEQTVVRAPANGIVAERMARIGDVTAPSQALFSVIQDGALELQVRVPETQLPLVQPGATVEITSDADARIQVTGAVRMIAPLVAAQTREATVEIDLPLSPLLRPGMFLQAAIATETVEGLAVPAGAILPQGDGKSLVYVVEPDNRVRAQSVETGTVLTGSVTNPEDSLVEIKSGLKVGDRLVLAGAAYLKDGDRVSIVKK